MKIKKGDKIQIIVGKDKGKQGNVLHVISGDKNKVVVEGLNIRKKHVRPTKEGEKGQRIEIPAPINISNVKLVCPKCGKLSRVGYKVENDNKFRICKKCNTEV